MPADVSRTLIHKTLTQTIHLHEWLRAQDPKVILMAAGAITDALRQGGKVLIFGNGGSAADAQHMAAELMGRFRRERRALPAVALTTDTSILTSIANDYSYEVVFARQIEGLGRRGDVAFGISTSGRSPNVLAAFAKAKAAGLTTIALTGYDGGPIGREAVIHLNVPDDSTARVQEVHRTILHIICELVENDA